MGQENRESLKSQTSADGTINLNSSEALIRNEPIGDTGLRMVGDEMNGYHVVVGRIRLTEPYRTAEEAIQQVDERINWKMVQNLIMGMILFREETKHLDSEIKHVTQNLGE